MNLATIAVAARAYRIPASTLRRWMAVGWLTRHGTGKVRLVDLDELDQRHDKRVEGRHDRRARLT